MKITDETIDHLAHLSRLEFNGDQKVRIKSDLKEFPNRLIESIWQSSLELAERPLISGLSLNQAGRFGQCFPDRDLA